MAYKVGDKFVIEIDSVMTNKKGRLYGIKGFKSCVFDDYGLEQLDKLEVCDDTCDEACNCFDDGIAQGIDVGKSTAINKICDWLEAIVNAPEPEEMPF